ncbi:MAG: MoaD/ThiS family protein [Bacteroidota bacterium]
MPKINFTSALKRFFPDLEAEQIEGSNVSEVLENLEKVHPGICDYLIDEQGQLRKHVNIFLDGELIRDREHLMDKVGEKDELFIFQALSGG